MPIKINGKTVEINFQYDGKFYIAECHVSYHTENYGEDADGNRGMPRRMIDDVHILSIRDEEAGRLVLNPPMAMEDVVRSLAEVEVEVDP